jgi:hypothetical protein
MFDKTAYFISRKAMLDSHPYIHTPDVVDEATKTLQRSTKKTFLCLSQQMNVNYSTVRKIYCSDLA